MHHGVRITDAAIVAAAVLSDRYITDRFLPDKAIDLIDEAASPAAHRNRFACPRARPWNREIRQLEIEREALRKESDRHRKERLGRLERELADLQERARGMRTRWEQEKGALEAIRDIKERMEQVRHEADRAEQMSDFGRAAELRYGQLNELQRGLEQEQARLVEMQGDHPLLKEEVGAEDIAEVVSRWSGVPLNKMLEGEMQKLLRIEQDLHSRVVGQDDAINAIANAVRRGRAGLGGSQPADRVVHLPRAHRCRQDGGGTCARRTALRRRALDGPDRHERVHGEAHGRASSARLPATSATRRADSSPKRCGAGHTACSS